MYFYDLTLQDGELSLNGWGGVGGRCCRLAGDVIAAQTRPRRNADETMWNSGLFQALPGQRVTDHM